MLTQCRLAAEISGHKLISDEQKDSGHVFCGQMCPCFSLLLGKMDNRFHLSKMRQTIQAIISKRGSKGQSLKCYGNSSVSKAWITCMCAKVIYAKTFKRYMLLSRQHLLLGGPCLFLQENVRSCSA